ncbi:hypothetical protein ATANTOWER_005033 [Ataeniobius toweri]|uniref:Uncharacterized protein n=1 Tax=Ataeniobius toweri TaxID=208326 RepID=A0ABU7AM85_9TELE|nr:hypothetical protein [Ataeniobius toweri]
MSKNDFEGADQDSSLHSKANLSDSTEICPHEQAKCILVKSLKLNKTQIWSQLLCMYVWRSLVAAFKPKNTVAAFKHGIGSIMLRCCFYTQRGGCFTGGGWTKENSLQGIDPV